MKGKPTNSTRAVPARLELAGMDLNNDRGFGQVLSNLPGRIPPVNLTASLLVMASRESQRVRARRSVRQICASWYDRLGLAVNNVMRPLALPFAGGLCSAVVLFSMWVVPTYPLLANNNAFDIPTMLTPVAYIQASGTSTVPVVRRTAPLGVSGADVVVDVTVDDQGRMVNYTIVSGAAVLLDLGLRHRLENFLLLTQFTPATSFGHPTAGKVRIPFHTSSDVVVKG